MSRVYTTDTEWLWVGSTPLTLSDHGISTVMTNEVSGISPYNKIGVQLVYTKDTSNELVYPLPTLSYIKLYGVKCSTKISFYSIAVVACKLLRINNINNIHTKISEFLNPDKNYIIWIGQQDMLHLGARRIKLHFDMLMSRTSSDKHCLHRLNIFCMSVTDIGLDAKTISSA